MAHLGDSTEDSAGRALAEGVDDVSKEDRDEGLGHAVAHRPERADHHEQHVEAVGVPEHAEQWNLLLRPVIFSAVGVACSFSTASFRCRVHFLAATCFVLMCSTSLAALRRVWFLSPGVVEALYIRILRAAQSAFDCWADWVLRGWKRPGKYAMENYTDYVMACD